MNHYTTRVLEAIGRTPTAMTLRMEKPDGFAFHPGQWGYFSLQTEKDPVSRSLSFSSSPTEPHLEFTKRLSQSDFCQALRALKPGDELSFSGPMGNLVYEGGLDKVTFLAGGIGITPIRSILKNAMDHAIPGQKYLIYGNLNVEETAFAEEIADWQKKDAGLEVIHVLNDPPEGWSGYTGYISTRIIEESVPDLADQTFYVSGPPPMVNAVLANLDELGIHRDRILKEELEGYEGMV